jgi:hypothetical protein
MHGVRSMPSLIRGKEYESEACALSRQRRRRCTHSKSMHSIVYMVGHKDEGLEGSNAPNDEFGGSPRTSTTAIGSSPCLRLRTSCCWLDFAVFPSAT